MTATRHPLARSLVLLASAALLACTGTGSPAAAQASQPSTLVEGTTGTPLAPPPEEGEAFAIFAGGCFWCMEGPFEALDGVREVLSGYTGGPEVGPRYDDVARGRTGHTEAVYVLYDPQVIGYDALVEVFWRTMDPTDNGGQFADRGSQYRPGIFVRNDAERSVAEASKAALAASGRFDRPIVVPIEDAQPFYVAEDYHQNYYRTNPEHYARYRQGSGRGPFLERVWGSAD